MIFITQVSLKYHSIFPNRTHNLMSKKILVAGGGGFIDIISKIAGVTVERNHDLNAPQGVRGRNSDNTLILDKLGWKPEVD